MKTPYRRQFTVIGYFESTGQTFCHHVQAFDANEAPVEAFKDKPEADDAVLVAILSGHRNSHMECNACSVRDWPGMEVMK